MPQKFYILVIDDTAEFLRDVRRQLKDEFQVTTCKDPLMGIRKARRNKPDLILTTLVMKELGGLDLIRRLRGQGYDRPIIMATRFGDASTAVEATRVGATDYITRPLVREELISRIKRILEENACGLPSPLDSLYEGICTADPQMRALIELAHIAADTDCRILILGETGTGKELLARAIHRYSKRASQSYVVLNCAAIQENLLESELFGHERGAFTGAIEGRKGRFEEATGGTLFLDEIGEISLSMQAKLLRVLQSGEYSRVGGNKKLQSSARIVAATNRDLREDVNEGKFRADLFFRLNVVSLTPPPLRERPVDIQLLARYFLNRFTRDGSEEKSFSSEAMEALLRYNWPGNVREMEHLIERLSILVRHPIIEVLDLPSHLQEKQRLQSVGANSSQTDSYKVAKEEFERDYFVNIHALSGENFAEGARIAGMERSVYYRKATRYLPRKS